MAPRQEIDVLEELWEALASAARIAVDIALIAGFIVGLLVGLFISPCAEAQALGRRGPPGEIQASAVHAAESTTWRPGDLVVVHGYCATQAEVELYLETGTTPWRCTATRTPAGWAPLAAMLLEWVAAAPDGRGGSVSVWRMAVGAPTGAVTAFSYLGQGGGPHPALEAR